MKSVPSTRYLVVVAAVAITAFSAHHVRGEVVGMQIDQRSAFADGRVFGRSGPYERISGRMFLEVDPEDPGNARITDIRLAPRNDRGRVACWTDFFLLKPVDPARGNRRILFDVHNRGNKLAVWTFNESPIETANNPETPDAFYRPRRLDFGSRWYEEGIADIVPPKLGPPYRTLVPAVDADGNELAGIRLPDVAVPTATYTGWNLRAAEYGAGDVLAGLHGGYHPFAGTPAEGRAAGDPRPSVLQRYSTASVYLAKMTEAALRLQREGFLLEEDVVTILRKATEASPIDKAR